jgi:putative glutamine amidotransferase
MNKNQPLIIGIPGCKVGDDFFGAPVSYIKYMQYFGTPRILSLEEEVDERVDLLILSGGADVNPLRYGQMPELYTSRPDPFKEYFDIYVLPNYIKAGVPILGICRGIQTLAVHFGAKLVQHMIHPYSSDDRGDTTHNIELLPTTFKEEFEAVYGRRKISVNSLHHQCVSSEDFPEELEIIGIYPHKENASIEVIRHRTLPIYGVQYHPEELTKDALGDFIVNILLQASKNVKAQIKSNLEYA